MNTDESVIANQDWKKKEPSRFGRLFCRNNMVTGEVFEARDGASYMEAGHGPFFRLNKDRRSKKERVRERRAAAK